MLKIRNRLWKLLLFSGFLFVFCVLFGEGFSIDVQVDKNEIRFGESLTLAVTLTQEMSGFGGQRLGPVEISEIPGFDIVSRRSANNMTMINGVGQIQVQTIFELVPKGPGDYTIPAMSVKGPGGKIHTSKPIRVKVLPPSNSDETSTKEDSPGGEESEKRESIGLLKGILIVFFVIGLIVASPILLSWFMTRNSRPSTKWEEKPKEKSKEEISSVGISREQKKNEVKKPSVETVSEAEVVEVLEFDFEKEVNALKRLHSDVGPEFYRAYFDLFHKALLQKNKKLEPSMTPDELVKHLSALVLPAEVVRLKRIGNDWETVVFANSRPSRQFSAIHEDALVILKS